jgi:hypothetical protein
VKCTTAQANSGDVAGCVIASAVGLPESRGWPTPPFPDPGTGTPTPWVDVARGASGATVTRIQQALIANGASIVADGQFGPATETAVRNYQTAHALAVTGIVDTATATALGLVNTTVPVFPPAGWTWLGWAYNGSPILHAWESQLVANASQIGTVRPGTVKAFPDALPLFEGFLAEIQARGYVVRDEGTYAFRCTASTTKDCHGLTRAALSNHAYGLASDFNTAQNPMKTYYGVGGKSACQTPIITDIPQWVVVVRRSVSQPLFAIMSQLPKFVAHVPTPQTLAVQVSVATLGRLHALLHEPQVAGSARLVSHPSAVLPLQLAKPVVHAIPHAPVVQVAVAFEGVGQTRPHIPQLDVSVARA